MHILIAPNAFKNSLDAARVAEAISNGLQQSQLTCTTTCFPIADGGDGTAELLMKYLKGERIAATVHDPLKRKIESSFGWIEKDKTAIIELAAASGLRLLQQSEYDPKITTTFGTGELIIQALNKGATKLLLCIGGSATVDGGTGILRALGIKFLDDDEKEITDLPASLRSLSRISITNFDKRIAQTEIIILCDVENTLLGLNGAARVFGPQKGASEKEIDLLEAGLTNFNNVVINTVGKDMSEIKHGGAAGGVAAGLHVFLNARLVNGGNQFLAITDFEKELRKADLVITGEGSIDEQTLHGKGPVCVANMAKKHSLPVIGMAGKIPIVIEDSLKQYFDQLISINVDNTDTESAIRNTFSNLEMCSIKFGDEFARTLKDN